MPRKPGPPPHNARKQLYEANAASRLRNPAGRSHMRMDEGNRSGHRMQDWLHDRDDHLPYYLAYGYSASRIPYAQSISRPTPSHPSYRPPKIASSPSNNRLPWATTNPTSPISPRKATSLRKATSISEHETSRDEDDASPTTFLERAISLRHRLASIGPADETGLSTDADNSIAEIRKDFESLEADISRSVPSHGSPSSQNSKRVARGASRQQASTSSSTSQSKSKGKQPVRRSNDAQKDEGEPSVAVDQHSKKARRASIRCPYRFSHLCCPAIKPYIRDIIKHIQTHGIYFCCDCSRYFEEEDALAQFNAHKDSHIEDRICIDLDCGKIPQSGPSHSLQNGCVEFKTMTTWHKYLSLFVVLLRGVARPSESQVFVAADSMCENDSNMHEPRDITIFPNDESDLADFRFALQQDVVGQAGEWPTVNEDQPMSFEDEFSSFASGATYMNARTQTTAPQQPNAIEPIIPQQNARHEQGDARMERQHATFERQNDNSEVSALRTEVRELRQLVEHLIGQIHQMNRGNVQPSANFPGFQGPQQ